MERSLHHLARAAAVLSLGAFVALAALTCPAQSLTNVTVRVMAANLTSGDNQFYEAPGIRIFQALKPDVVALQEFNYFSKPSSSAQIRNLVDTAFGADFFYYRETDSGYSIPNGIVSRYPILASGSWEDHDTGVNDRGFAWAQIDLPGTNDLYVVSVHLKASNKSGDAARRAAEASELKSLIAASFPANAWIIVAGDFNLYNETEGAITTLKTFLSDTPVPTDAPSGGDADTSAGRSERYDRVLSSFSLAAFQTNVVLPTRSFPNGLVFDSAVYSPLTDVAPVLSGDSHVTSMQHMGVVKDFRITYALTNPIAPPAISAQPQSRSVPQSTSASFNVTATGTEPLRYQWRFNGTNLPGATGSSYTRYDVQPQHVGNYTVVITNTAGSLASSNAVLQLIVPPPSLSVVFGSLEWSGLSNLSYTVQARTNLTVGDWQNLGSTSSPSGVLDFPLPDTSTSQTFFRVVYP